MSVVTAVVDKVVHVLKHEPVAVWGIVLAAVLGLLPVLGVPVAIVETLSVVLPLLGVPVVRGKVTALAALEALWSGAKGEAIAAPAVDPAPAVDAAPVEAPADSAPAAEPVDTDEPSDLAVEK